MNNTAQLESIINKPLLTTPEFAKVMVAQLQGDLQIINPSEMKAEVKSSFDTSFSVAEEIEPNIHVVDVFGSTAHRGGWWDLGYDDLKADISMALNDPEIDGIFMNFDTPGGAVAGCFDFCNWLKAANEYKPIWGISNESCYSAGYAMGSSCSRFLMPEGAGAGSIGVVMAHVSYEKAMEEAGVKVTFIHKGDQKVIGNPYQDLSDAEVKSFEAALEKPYQRFVSHVASSRGLDEEVVRDTEAGTFGAATAVATGFADEMLSADEAYLSFVDYLKGGNTTTIGGSMTLKEKEVSAEKADLEAAEAKGFALGEIAGKQSGTDEAVKAERARIVAILSHENMQGNEATGYLLIDTGADAASAGALLATLPKHESKEEDALGHELDGKSPGVGGGLNDGIDDEDDSAETHIADFTALVNKKEAK